MDTVKLYKRTLIYLLDVLIAGVISFSLFTPFFLSKSLTLNIYLILCFVSWIVIFPLFELAFLYLLQGYTLASFIFGVRFVSLNEKRPTFKQCVIRVICEAIFIFALSDFFFFLAYKTRRGAIDRLSNTFGVDVRKY